MDPADPGAITKALSAQGIIVGKHDSQIQEMVDTLRDLSNSMARMQTQLSLLTPGSAGSEGTPPGLSSSLAAGSTVSTPREPFVPTPESYAGPGRAVKRLLDLDLRQGSQSVAAYSVDFSASWLQHQPFTSTLGTYHLRSSRSLFCSLSLPRPGSPSSAKQRPPPFPPHRPYDCPIDLLPGASLPTSRLYNLSRPEREAMEKYIGESLAAGLIRPPSSSPLGAGFFFVEKKDKTLRPCIDFRGLNDITIKNKYPLPLIDPAFEPFHQATIFSKLDLRNAYHLVRIREGDEWKTAFNTPLGHFEYQFSLDTSPSEPASILPPSCIVGAASWDIETRVQEALKDHPAPNNCPKDRLFVPTTLLVAQDGSKTPRNTSMPALSVPVANPLTVLQLGSSNPFLFLTALGLILLWTSSLVSHHPKLPSALETASLLTDHVFRLHGLPTDIVSDRGPQFTSQVPSRKLAPRYIGPYVVEKIINPSSVRLKLPPSLYGSTLPSTSPSSSHSLLVSFARPPTPLLPQLIDGHPAYSVKESLSVNQHKEDKASDVIGCLLI
ncbi:hypothetical protein L3Q82_001674 [Scortum barcoo]|uniref:Uncharacterized protein n=1 Tax=Scortum barcoo TaxID=214431 RepID=A0ACB8W5T9_9TELE|nr:hypothetical protein L3Q82_001674 [Scortum barcoo]